MTLIIIQYMLFSLCIANGSFKTVKPTRTTTELQPVRAATETTKIEALTQEKLAKKDLERVEKMRFRLLSKIELEGRPESNWDGRFPSGPVEDYKRLYDKGLEKENRDVILAKIGNHFNL